MSSILGSLALHSDPASPIYDFKVPAYNVSKSAVNAWTVQLAYELRDTPIKVNAVHPGSVKTDMNAQGDLEIADGAQTSVAHGAARRHRSERQLHPPRRGTAVVMRSFAVVAALALLSMAVAVAARTPSARGAAATPKVPPAQRDAIVDALYRFGAGQDLRDRALFESAFAQQAVLDFTEPAKRVGGATIGVFTGRDAIADTVFANIDGLDTTHTVTNPRITAYDGDRATLIALVEAQHLPRDDHSRHLLLKNVYEVRLTRQGAHWVIEHLRIDNVWTSGDPAVLFPDAATADTATEPSHA